MPGLMLWSGLIRLNGRRIEPFYVLSFQALFTFDYFKAYFFSFSEGFKALTSDLCVMYEDVLASILNDEPEARFVVEPLNLANGHTFLS